MKVMLIIPPSELFNKEVDCKAKKKVGLLPPLGILLIGSILKKYGNDINIIDAQLYNLSFNSIMRRIKEFGPGLVGISFITAQRDAANLLIHKIKSNVSVKIIVGGAHPICFPYETIAQNKDIDILVYGDAENVIAHLVSNIENNEGLSDVGGILYREKDRIITNKNSKNVADLDKLPFPARDLIPIESYLPSPFENKREPSTSIIVSRGCTYSKCTFCYRSSNMKKEYRCQSVKKTMAEIELLINRYGIKELIFYDDDLLANKEWVNDLCENLIKNNFDLIWSFRGRSCNADYNVFKKVKRAGCWNIEVGFESGNQELLDKIKKGVTLGQSRNMVKWCNELKINTVGTFIVALPGETYKKGINTVNFAIDLGCSYAAFIPAHPSKGTIFYEQCAKEGTIIKEDYTAESNLSWFIPRISYLPKGYKDQEEVLKLIRIAYARFYFRPKYLIKSIISIRTRYDVKRYFNGLKFMIGILKS